MKVDRSSRGEKKFRGCHALVVTVPNEESGESRLKPPVISSHPRKIVLSQNKTVIGSTDLNKVTVKSLDEIKREKEQRQKESTATSLQSAKSAAQIPNGGKADVLGNSSKLLTNTGPGVRAPLIAKRVETTSTAHVSGVNTNLSLKELTIPLKALPSNCKIMNRKSELLASSSPPELREVSMDMDSHLPEQDFDYLDEDEDSSDVTDGLDEDFLLGDDEEMHRSHSGQDSNDFEGLHFDGMSGYTDTTFSEPEDDEISLHPDDSLFDEEDESTGNNERQHPRSLGRRSGSEPREFRAKLGDKQKHVQESPSSPVKTAADEPETERQETEVESKQTGIVEDRVQRRSDNREGNQRNHFYRTSKRNQDKRGRPGVDRRAAGWKNGRLQFGRGVSRRGAPVSRNDKRKGSGLKVASKYGRLLVPFGSGDGLLPLPSTSSVPVDFMNNLQAASAATMLNIAIKKNIQDTVEMLTNPPPVPGETVARFEESLRQPSVPHVPQEAWGKQPFKRQQSNLQGSKNAGPPGAFSKTKAPAAVHSQQNVQMIHTRPKWLQKTFSDPDTIEQGTVNQVLQGNSEGAVPPHETAKSDENVLLARGRLRNLERTGSQNDTNSQLSHHSPSSILDSDIKRSPRKRKSPFRNEDEAHGGKIAVGTNHEEVPRPNHARTQKTYPKPLCPQQLQTGKCLDSRCQCWHLPKPELEEHQRLQQPEQSQEHLTTGQSAEQPALIQQQQKKEDVTGVSYDVVNALLKDHKLSVAWQMIERLRRMNHPPELSILQHVLYLCSKHKEEPDVAAQVACKAFDMIGGMVKHHNRHNYETLIKALCHSGQYIRAYEMLDVMKKNSHSPTYEVFLDLIQASEKDPDWAFNLLDEIKQAGVFRSKICSDLILLGCSSGEMFVERTVLLFQEALEKNVQLTPDAISTVLFFLFETNHWEKIMPILPSIPDKVPLEILKAALLNALQRADWTDMVITALAMSSAEKLTELEADVWNGFLRNCCQGQSDNASFAQRIYSLMQQNGIPLLPEAINDYMALQSQKNCTAAFELFVAVSEGPQGVEQPQTLEGGLNALSVALDNGGLGADMLRVVYFMLEHQIKPVDSVLQSGVKHLDKEENFKGVYQFFKQLETAEIVPPFSVYKAMISSLEKWGENPTASFEPYVSMRRAYPAGEPSETGTNNEDAVESEKKEKRGKRVCKYYFTKLGCYSGEKCNFLHPEGPKHLVNSSQDGSPPLPSNTYKTPAMKVAQDSGLTSEGRATRSTTDGTPVIAQAHGTQPVYSGVPAVASQVAQPLEGDQMSHLGTETVPFALQKASGLPVLFTETSSRIPKEEPHIRVDDGVSCDYTVGSINPQKQGICRYFATPRGCRFGDQCQFVHNTNTVSMPSNSKPPLSDVPSVGNRRLAAPDSHSGTAFVLRGAHLPSGQTAGITPFGHVSSFQNTSFMAGPISSASQMPFSKLPSVGSHHFQLAGPNPFRGKNPFSPTVPGRTRSMEGFGEPKEMEQMRQAHSAPIVSQMPGESFFYYPSKTNLQFYLPRIKHASQNKSWEDLGLIYITMRNADVEIDSSVLKAFYQSFETFCPDTVGSSFEKFASKVQVSLRMVGIKDADPERSPSSLLDAGDKCFFGQLGVALMYFCYQKKSFSQGYNVLHVLHNFSINYSLYTGEFGIQQRPLTTTEVSLTAADICLHLDNPANTSALEVLRGTNYALPVQSSGALLSPEEALWRRHVVQTLCQSFMSDNQFDLVYELLTEVGDIDVFGRRQLKALYNELLVNLINNNELDVAGDVLKSMETNLLSRDAETVRAFVKGFGEAGRIAQAKQHFMSGCISGVYPISFNQDNPWTVVIGTSFSPLESQLFLEKHLQHLYHYIEELAKKSGDGVLDDNYHKPLTVVIGSDELPNSNNKYEIIRCVREMLYTVLTDDFNPPLSCQPQSDEEVTVDALSLKRWFCANAASGRSKQAGFPLTTLSQKATILHPYLQPGMTNLGASDSQEGASRKVCVVSEGGVAPWQGQKQTRNLRIMSHHGQGGRARPMSFNRAMSGRGRTKVPKTA